MEKETYRALRNEITTIFNSFRHLIIAQFAAVALLIVEILTTTISVNVLALGFVLALIIIIVTITGTTWWVQADRQASYLLLAYELPELKSCQDKSGVDRKHLWVLANRSESLRSKATGRFWDRYYAGHELRTFYIEQFLLTFASIVIVIASLLFKFGLPLIKPLENILAGLTGLSLLAALILTRLGWSRSNQVIQSITEKMQTYLETRVTSDTNYLQESKLWSYVEHFHQTAEVDSEDDPIHC